MDCCFGDVRGKVEPRVVVGDDIFLIHSCCHKSKSKLRYGTDNITNNTTYVQYHGQYHEYHEDSVIVCGLTVFYGVMERSEYER